MLHEISKESYLFIDRIQILFGILFYCGLHKISIKYIPDTFIKKNRIIQYHTYTYSILHSIIISITCVLYLLNYLSQIKTSFLINLSIGYTIYDFTVLINNYEIFDWKGITLHHVAMLLLLAGRESYFNEVVIGLLSELSTIFLNISWILYQSDRTNNIYFKLNSLLVLVAYFFTRVLNFPYLTYISLSIYDLNPVFIFMIVFLSLLNIYWFRLLVLKAYSVKTKSQKKIIDKSE